MKAFKYEVYIPKSHQIAFRVTEEVPEGPAELILFIHDKTETPAHEQKSLQGFLDEMATRPRGKSQQELDKQIQEERHGWE